jgi:hypothetical protein
MTSNGEKQCTTCKIIGTGAFTGITGYILYTQYDMAKNKAPADHRFNIPMFTGAGMRERARFTWKYGPRWLTFLAAGSLSLAIARWNAPM